MNKLLFAGLIFLCACTGNTTGGFSADNNSDAGDGGEFCPVNNIWEHTTDAWVLKNPAVNIVFWGNWWTSTGVHADTVISEAWNSLASDPIFYLPATEYGVGPGFLAGLYNRNGDVPAAELTEAYIKDELQAEIAQGELNTPTNDSIYVIMLPPGTTSKYDVDAKFGGHHGYISSDSGNFTFAVIENNDANGMVYTTSHEIYEAATNPDTGNGWWGPGGETEVADLCGGNYSLDGFVITRIWSEKTCSCVPQALGSDN